MLPPAAKGKIMSEIETIVPVAAATTCSAFLAALARMHARGMTRISANSMANELWPNARHNNSHGQSFNLAAGVAGGMLRRNRGCHEVENRVWEIIPEFLPNVRCAPTGAIERRKK